MTPKEKADSLFAEMYKNCTMTIAGAGTIWKPLVKNQYFICVDELINAFKELSISESGAVHIDYGHGYWQQVKTEIENHD